MAQKWNIQFNMVGQTCLGWTRKESMPSKVKLLFIVCSHTCQYYFKGLFELKAKHKSILVFIKTLDVKM